MSADESITGLRVPVGPEPQTSEPAAEQLDFLHRITLPELRREIEHHKDGKARWRKRAETAEARVAELEKANAGLDDLRVRAIDKNEHLRRQIAELEARNERAAAHTEHLAATLVARTQDLMAVEGRLAELEAARTGSGGHSHPEADDVTPQVQKLRALLAGQRTALEDPHDSPLHHDYRVGRDLPETGGAK